MRGVAMTVIGAAFALAAIGCGERPVVRAPEPFPEPAHVEPAPDASGLTFLLAPDLHGTATSKHATDALRAAMEKAGYRVVDDPIAGYDAELVPRAYVWAWHGKSTSRSSGLIEHVRFSVTAVVDNHVVDAGLADFIAVNGEVTLDHVVPALNALGESTQLLQLGKKLQRGRASAQR